LSLLLSSLPLVSSSSAQLLYWHSPAACTSFASCISTFSLLSYISPVLFWGLLVLLFSLSLSSVPLSWFPLVLVFAGNLLCSSSESS
jgi:hypothetical protein